MWDCKHVDIGACESKWFVRRYFRRLFFSLSVCLCYQGKHGTWLTANTVRERLQEKGGSFLWLQSLPYTSNIQVSNKVQRCLHTRGPGKDLSWLKIFGFYILQVISCSRVLTVLWSCCWKQKSAFKARWAVYFCLYIFEYLSCFSIFGHQSY